MKILNNISIKNRLMLILAAWIVVFLGIGFFAVHGMWKMSNITNNIHDELTNVSNAAIEARSDVIRISRDSKDLILMQDAEDIKKQYIIIQAAEARVVRNIDVIRAQVLIGQNEKLEQEVRDLYHRWKQSRGGLVELMLAGNREEAASISRQNNEIFVLPLEEKLVQISKNADNKADILMQQAAGMVRSQTQALGFALLSVIGISIFIFSIIIRSIIEPINALKGIMNAGVDRGELSELEITGNNEVVDMAGHYNTLVGKLRNMFWIKDSQNSLNVRLSGNISLGELTENAIMFLSRLLEAGSGAFYIYDKEGGTLSLQGSFALADRQKSFSKIMLGEGIVGQVAYEKKPVLLKNIKSSEAVIRTGTITEAPLNTYTFPLVYEDELYGVIELASFESFDQLKQDFLDEAARLIAMNLYAVLQNQKVRNLLEETELARIKAQELADELIKANGLLVSQQNILQQQAGELQQANAELEEQQMLLQQQSEELIQTNSQLEEQQQMLEEQSRLLHTKNQELELTNKYKSQFLANMSHELRTPLNSIILLSKLLSNNDNGTLGEKDIQKVTVIHRSGQELLRLINDVLDLSKIESGKMDLNVTWFSSQDLLTELKQMFEGQAREKKIRLIMEDHVNASLKGDRDKISQILRNLLSNAIKFTQEGTVSLRLVSDGKDGVVFNVADTGIGISSENIPVIFEEFKQGDGSVSRKFGGTGLGLSISKKLAELMGGVIEVESEVAVGSTFSMRIDNIIEAENGERCSLPGDTDVADEPGDTVEFIQKSDKIVLVIEDDPDFAQYIKKLNEGMGFDTLLAGTGRDGLKLARKYKVDGILLDLGLPDISGIDVLRELKGSAELRGIPVHILSVSDKDSKLQKMGAIGYKRKSSDEREIVNAISKLIAFSNKKTKQLLIADNDPVQTQAIKTLLKAEDVEIMTAATIDAAKFELGKGIYDAVILDLELENEFGIELCKFIGEQRMETPTIIYTGNELTVAQEKEIRKYADSIIVKTANSQQRLLDEVTLFLHRVKKNNKDERYIYSINSEGSALNLKGKKILLVDDDPRNIFVLAAALENYGAEILEAENGKAALEKLKDWNADLILMDIMMPVMDGYDAIKSIRAVKELEKIPIIALTAKTLKGDREKCIAAGANDYISKPVDHEVLITLIRAWIDK